MKKLTLLAIAFILSGSLLGQSAAKKHSLSLVVGPNWEKAIRFGLLDDDILFRTGYSLGVDYFQTLTPRWQAKISARYHQLNFAKATYSVQLDSNGHFPISSATLVKRVTHVRNNAWSFTAGIRRFGKPSNFRWFWAGEVGATIFVANPRLPAATLGLGTGWEWISPQKVWTVSAQPVFRLMFWGSEDAYSDHVALAFELGLRRIFDKKANL